MNAEDIRPVLADIMASHGNALGAETLRHTHEVETTPRGDEVDELGTLRQFVDDLGGLLTHPPVGPRGAVKHQALIDDIQALHLTLICPQ